MEAIQVQQATHGKVPNVYGFDRGGYSSLNIKKAKKMGVQHVGIAPTGKASWAVSDSMAEKIKRERAQVDCGLQYAKIDTRADEIAAGHDVTGELEIGKMILQESRGGKNQKTNQT